MASTGRKRGSSRAAETATLRTQSGRGRRAGHSPRQPRSSPVARRRIVTNAALGSVSGSRIGSRAEVVGGLVLLAGGLALLDFEFTDFENGQCYFGATPDVDLDGDGVPSRIRFDADQPIELLGRHIPNPAGVA